MRTPITLKIKFKSASLDQFIERYSVDVSRGGIFIRTKEPLQVGTQLKFEFQLQDTTSLIAGEGTVVWIREHDPNRTGVAPGMGVRFDRLAPASTPVLEKILAEKAKRGDAQMESRFDAGVRASASASGTMSSDRAAAHNDFAGGDSKMQTPLPAPAPGLSGAEDEFSNESTRVMQDEVVQALADKTRGAQAPRDDFADEPTRRASAEQVAQLKATSAPDRASVSAIEESQKPSSKVEVAIESKVEVAETKPPPPPPKKTKEAAAAAAGGASVGKSAEKGKARAPDGARPATATGAAPRKSSGLPLILTLAVLVAGGAYYAVRGTGSDSAEGQASTAPPPPAPAQAKAPMAAVRASAPQPEAIVLPPAPPSPAAPSVPAVAAPAPAIVPAAPPAAPAAVAAKPAAAGLALTVASDPAGAQIAVDGKPVAQPTPTVLEGLDPKKVYEVRLSLKGFHDWKVKLKPKSGEKLEAALVPNERLVEVSSKPQGADVLFDGRKLGKTPFVIHKLDVTKSHAIEVKRVGFVPQQRSVSASDAFESKGDKEVLAIALELQPEPVAAVAARPARRAPVHPTKKPASAAPVTAESEPAAAPAAAEKTVAVEKPAGEKPAPENEKPVADKPVEKPAPAAAAEKPEKKPPAEKPAERPAIKTPSWMKQKPEPSEGAPSPDPAQ